MKTIKFSLLLVFLLSPILLFSFISDRTSDSFRVATYPAAGSTKLMVVVQKPEGRVVQLRILNQQGQTLATEKLAKKLHTVHTRFDLTELPDGVYRVEITDFKNKQIEQFTLRSPRVTASRQLSIRTLD